MERHDSALVSVRVYILDLCPRKASCLRSILCRLPLCSLGTSPGSSQVAPPLDLH
ncbi:hypothetical protein B296_00005457 [Ensete ventricosum]|uniref:Uncharacterized protein n=1 Tax=Ensete ventricosum TaxID=4639 RepID=A0A427BBT9_ENSVE|nr:hypothetical protein B296_00005457 [Ensete ventricosum]